MCGVESSNAITCYDCDSTFTENCSPEDFDPNKVEKEEKCKYCKVISIVVAVL